jgi:methionyl-tRNA formyltransferase
MKSIKAVFLMSDTAGKRAYDLAKEAGLDLDLIIVNNVCALERAFSIPRDLLLSFGTGIIVPPWVLAMEGMIALNVHAASPGYPGRDPHHFAVYDGAKQYGATMHYMLQSVDAGPITDVEIFDIPTGAYPLQLLELANDACWRLISRFFSAYKKHSTPFELANFVWGKRKSTRKMFLEMCRVDLDMPQDEIARRLRATTMPGYKNLYIDLHGYRFRIEDQAV